MPLDPLTSILLQRAVGPPAASHFQDRSEELSPMASHPLDRSTWEKRPDGTTKGDGFLGILQRPDGGVMSEYSIATDDFGGKDFPSIVPTLNAGELHYLLNARDQDSIPESIVQKALAFVKQRQSQGKPFFADKGEQDFSTLPNFKRRY